MNINFLENEYWYGMCVKYGVKMPFSKDTKDIIDCSINTTPNQAMPLLLSSKGRVLWSKKGFKAEFDCGIIKVSDDVILEKTGENLKDAYKYASGKFFPFEDKIPAIELFEKVVYNSWIELTFYQNQRDILEYANKIIESGMPSGVLMIDDGWSEYYGDWRFHSGKFPNPKEMIKKLNELGFKVMLWVCPFITCDSVKYREAVKKDILIKNSDGEVRIVKWWNGYSALLDFTNPNAKSWLKEQLVALENMGIDGFKFDAGDSIYYLESDVTYKKVDPNEQSRLWAEFGKEFAFNEYRVTFNAGGYPLMQRLCDKPHSWGEDGVASLIPDTLLQGITGHLYGSPDMIGGGEYLNFQEMENSKLDEELFVRHSEIACLLPVMQFSAAPFRVLSKENFQRILNSIKTREKYIEYILQLVKEKNLVKEPIIRYMAYEFPNENVEKIIDQFMLGDRYLVAPIYEKGKDGREIYIPKGRWKYNEYELESVGESRYFNCEKGVPTILERIKS